MNRWATTPICYWRERQFILTDSSWELSKMVKDGIGKMIFCVFCFCTVRTLFFPREGKGITSNL